MNGVNRRRLVGCTGAALAMLALGACSMADGTGSAAGTDGDSTAGSTADAGEKRSINVGFLYDVHAANVWTMDQCETDAIDVQLTNFKQFAEVQRAFEGDQIDAAAMGYQNMAQMIGNGYEDFRGVAGVYTGAEHIVIKAGSGIGDWSDLSGKKVGLPPNSFVEMLFRSAMDEAGVSLADVEIVPFPGGGPPLLAALESGDIDAMVTWEPNAASAAVQGIGEYPSFNIQDGAIGDATSVLYVSEELLAEDAAVEELVACLQERTEALSADLDGWTQVLMENTGLSEEVARTAIGTGALDTNLYQDSAERIITEFANNGLVEDTSDRVAEMFDYGPLERVTGKDASELGAK